MTKTPENHSFKNLENHTSKTQKITPTKPTKSQLQSLENQYLIHKTLEIIKWDFLSDFQTLHFPFSSNAEANIRFKNS